MLWSCGSVMEMTCCLSSLEVSGQGFVAFLFNTENLKDFLFFFLKQEKFMVEQTLALLRSKITALTKQSESINGFCTQ